MVTRLSGKCGIGIAGSEAAIPMYGTSWQAVAISQALRRIYAPLWRRDKGLVMLAYFDPGSGSMLVQVLVGGVAGLAVFARYLWDHFGVSALLRRRKSKASVVVR